MNKLIFLIAFFTVVIGFQLHGQTPDFTPTLEINNAAFQNNALPRDVRINISEIGNSPSVGSLFLKIPKMTAFDIAFDSTMTMVNVYGGLPVNNSLWIKTENILFITLQLKPGVVISPYSIASIGLTITRKPGVMSQTTQPLTIAIMDNTGGETNSPNNTYNLVLMAL